MVGVSALVSGGLGGLVHYLAGNPRRRESGRDAGARNVRLLAELPRCGDRATGALSIVLVGLTLTGKA